MRASLRLRWGLRRGEAVRHRRADKTAGARIRENTEADIPEPEKADRDGEARKERSEPAQQAEPEDNGHAAARQHREPEDAEGQEKHLHARRRHKKDEQGHRSGAGNTQEAHGEHLQVRRRRGVQPAHVVARRRGRARELLSARQDSGAGQEAHRLPDEREAQADDDAGGAAQRAFDAQGPERRPREAEQGAQVRRRGGRRGP